MNQPAPNQRFTTLLGLSFVLHALIFAGLTWQRQAPRQLQPLNIIATLRQAVSDNTSANTSAYTSPKISPHPGPIAEKPRLVAPVAIPQQAKRQPRHGHQSVPAAGFVQPPIAVAVAETPTSQASPPMAAQTTASVAPVAPQNSLLAAYRQRLTEIFAGQQTYPRVAALRGWEGEVRLRLRVARKGNLLAVHLDHSSGFDVLDQHALAMLEQLASLPPLPDGLDVNEIQVVVPVNYKLKKTT